MFAEEIFAFFTQIPQKFLPQKVQGPVNRKSFFRKIHENKSFYLTLLNYTVKVFQKFDKMLSTAKVFYAYIYIKNQQKQKTI